MEYLQTLLDNNNIPALTAIILGLLTAISPCPMATNITAIGFISKDIENRNRIFWNGILYTLGRVMAYTILGIILISILREGASIFAIQKTISRYGSIILGPILIIIGIFMLWGDKLHLPQFGYQGNNEKGEKIKRKGSAGAIILGILFAMAFCPTSALFYFGMLIPMSAIEPAGWLYPLLFAIATALPVIIIAWILAYSMASLANFYSKLQLFQRWFNRIIAIIFIGIGIYYCTLI